jgi:hypothetical protein
MITYEAGDSNSQDNWMWTFFEIFFNFEQKFKKHIKMIVRLILKYFLSKITEIYS